VAEQIAALFVQPFPLAGREHFVTASIGIALSGSGPAAGPESLIRDADAAMYRAKANGRASYELFDEAMRARATHRLRVESELHRALERDDLVLHYQPIVRLSDGEILGAEALVRWQHPVNGLLSPAEFVPVAEQSGLIVALGEWVLRAACREAAGWQSLRPDGPMLTVSVNLAPRQVGDPELVGVVTAALEDSGLDPALLLLEITETALLEDAERPNENLRRLRELGIAIHLDDFGTGYSSLGLLKRLRPAGLKIDRSFVGGLGQDPEDGAIVSAVAGMARGLGVGVTAEGVETSEQAEELRRLGIQRAQGFHFARPVAGKEFRTLAGRPVAR
jgi:EAL domain-containing protein (putative c-di-GMP-specific phosphodiesterase class I)